MYALGYIRMELLSLRDHPYQLSNKFLVTAAAATGSFWDRPYRCTAVFPPWSPRTSRLHYYLLENTWNIVWLMDSFIVIELYLFYSMFERDFWQTNSVFEQSFFKFLKKILIKQLIKLISHWRALKHNANLAIWVTETLLKTDEFCSMKKVRNVTAFNF